MIPYKNVQSVTKSKETDANVKITIRYESAERAPGDVVQNGSASFKLKEQELNRFFERLKGRNLVSLTDTFEGVTSCSFELKTQPNIAQRKQSRLKSPIPLNFDASGKSLTVCYSIIADS